MSSTATIKVDYLARIEGEGAFHIKINDNGVVDLKLRVFEPPRFFEAFLRGRSATEAPDITARICGICPIAHQLSSALAVEQAFGANVEGQLRLLRRLIYCGEWIESHALHIYLLHAPDFLGYQDALRMAKDHPSVAVRGLHLKQLGNEIMSVVGGRDIHPINMRVGGFYRLPTREDLAPLGERLKWAIEAAEETVKFAASLPMPVMERDYTLVALHDPYEYAIDRGIVVSNRNFELTSAQFEEQFVEEHVPYSNALRCAHYRHGSYLVGPLARFALNYAQLSERARATAQAVSIGPECRNPFQSIVIRSIELLYACEEALRIIDQYDAPDKALVAFGVQAGRGCACTEAPRGLLYHRYATDDSGSITTARIVPPTAQNQRAMEEDLREFVSTHLDLPSEQLTWQCEQAIRNYDPCISCATH